MSLSPGIIQAPTAAAHILLIGVVPKELKGAMAKGLGALFLS
jgi:hypothetical protein